MTKISLDLIKNSRLHDYEIVNIKIDYNAAYIILDFKTPFGIPCS